MFTHYFRLAARNLLRFRGAFIINVFGLSIGLASAILVFLWIRDEYRMDTFNDHDETLFQVMLRSAENGGIHVTTEMPPVLADALAKELPDIETAVTEAILPVKTAIAYHDKSLKADGAYVDPGYFELFSLGIDETKDSSLLQHENNIVLSTELAKALFGSSVDVVGQTVTLDGKAEMMVAGLFDFPANSSRRFDFALPFRKMFAQQSNFKNTWNNNWPSVYVRLRKDVDVQILNQKITDFYSHHSGRTHQQIFLERFSERYLHGNYSNGVRAGGRIQYVQLFSVIALAILVIACVNFANLATARATERLKEVGVKKSFGVSRASLTVQYLLESLVVSGAALLVALIAVRMLLPSFNLLTHKQLSLTFESWFVYGCIVVTVITALLSGLYPAFYLSAFNPTVIFRGNLRTSNRSLVVRKGLVVLQFSLSIIFVISVMVVYNQMSLIQNGNMGYAREGVVYFEMDDQIKTHQQAFLDGLRKVDGVKEASAIWWGFLGQRNSTSDIVWTGKEASVETLMQYRRVDDRLLEVLNIELADGKSFSNEEVATHGGIIFNSAAIEAMGLDNPVGKTVRLWGAEREIIGVAKNFHFETLYSEIAPLFFIYNPERTNTVMLRIDTSRPQQTVRSLERYYASIMGNTPLDLRFLNDDFQAQYAAEKRVEVLAKYFTLIAVLLSCLGVLGLASYTAERRTKEMGIRKTLGSSELDIVFLMTRDFAIPLLAAVAIAVPVAYFIISDWLDAFKLRVDLTWWYFVAGSAVAVCFCWITAGTQAIKIARMNPARGLRSE
ncbi:ABC transporter permease [Chryseolinea sp. T2]|uniref:ABC transporter permease n=1 Tax=Chryseolinea sp. T2 TaxID=3129255 RepID=UPI0030785AD8